MYMYIHRVDQKWDRFYFVTSVHDAAERHSVCQNIQLFSKS